MQSAIDEKPCFQGLRPRSVVGDFDGSTLTSDAGGLLLRWIDLALGFIGGFTSCFDDRRNPDAIKHSLRQLVAQRVFGICPGYEARELYLKTGRPSRVYSDFRQRTFTQLVSLAPVNREIRRPGKRRDSDTCCHLFTKDSLAGQKTLREAVPHKRSSLRHPHDRRIPPTVFADNRTWLMATLLT